MKAKELWEAYRLSENLPEQDVEAWAFGDMPDLLADLVLQGVKTATSSAYALYEIEGEPLPRAGEYSVILNSHDEPVCVIQTTKVYIARFNEVNEDHAYKEGEGNRSLSYWKRIHEDFFTTALAEAGMCFSEEMQVVCEEFKVVFK